MKLGKPPPHALASLLARLPANDPAVVLGPSIGEDAAAIRVGGRVVVAGMDPITFATDLIGWYAVQVNANDVAVMGARPKWFLGSLLVPPSASESELADIYDQLARACRELEITPIGGHTEVTATVTQPVIVGCMLGEMEPARLVRTGGAQPGDDIVLCGSVGLEGTAVLAREAAEVLQAKGLTPAELAAARSYLFTPGLSVVQAALAAAEVGVSAMHDPTEGGLATGLLELALASGTGLEVHLDRAPVSALTTRICELLGLNPMGIIASGALLITVAPDRTQTLLAALTEVGKTALVIGSITAKEKGLRQIIDGRPFPLPIFARDELARYFEETN